MQDLRAARRQAGARREHLAVDRGPNLFIPLFEAYSWFETGLQAYLEEAGWPATTRPQTMVLVAIAQGANRNTEIARRLGITPQSVGKTVTEMVELGLVDQVEDPADRRAKLLTISELGEKRWRDSRDAMRAMTRELGRRIGPARVNALVDVMSAPWGAPIETFPRKSINKAS